MHTPYNFGGLAAEYTNYKKAKIVVLPIPFDKTTTWGKGSDKGPKAMVEASMNMELYDIPTDSEVYFKGIFTAKDIKAPTPEKMVEMAYKKVKEFLADGKFVVSLGGEHSVSVGPIKAYAEKFKNLSVLHLDAHSDRRDSYDGSKLSHACAMARAKDYVKKITSVGIRSLDSSELKSLRKDKVFFAEDLMTPPNPPLRKGRGKRTPPPYEGGGWGRLNNWIKEAVSSLTDNVYITIDLDVFDSSIMPSTGTPEPGGMNWFQVTELLAETAKKKNIVGFDVVELAPTNYDKAPDFLAAKLVYRLLSYVFFPAKARY